MYNVFLQAAIQTDRRTKMRVEAYIQLRWNQMQLRMADRDLHYARRI